MSTYNYAVIGHFAGVDVIETPGLRWDQIIYRKGARKVVCGETQHFLYLLRKAQVFADMRADLETQLDAFAQRVGVDRSTVRE